MNDYLKDSEFIDWKHPEVLEKAKALAENPESKEAIAKACF